MKTTQTDEELVNLYIQSQNNLYFEKIYERYSQKVYHKCLSFVQDKAKAEDLTHDIFLKIAVKAGSFNERSRFSTWVYSITYNHCMDTLRTVKKRKEESLDFQVEFAEEEMDHEMASMQKEGLKKSLDQISPEEKSILLMKYQDDFSIKEIASSLNLSESAVKMRLLRSRERIKKLYLENIAIFALIVLKFWELLKK